MMQPGFHYADCQEILLSHESSPADVDLIAAELIELLGDADTFWRNRWSHPCSSMIMTLGLVEVLESLLVDERLPVVRFVDLVKLGWWPANPFCLARDDIPLGTAGDECFIAGGKLVGDLAKIGMDSHLFGAQNMDHGLWCGFLLFADAVNRRRFNSDSLKAMVTPLWKLTLVLRVVAEKPELPVESLILLAKHPVPSIREAVRLNPSTPVEVAVQLALTGAVLR